MNAAPLKQAAAGEGKQPTFRLPRSYERGPIEAISVATGITSSRIPSAFI